MRGGELHPTDLDFTLGLLRLQQAVQMTVVDIFFPRINFLFFLPLSGRLKYS